MTAIEQGIDVLFFLTQSADKAIIMSVIICMEK